MASINGKETKPEISVRRFLFKEGFRFRKNVKSLLGKPDIVLAKYNTIIFVHGCFWHGHRNCRKATLPATNTEFWKDKIGKNVARDKIVVKDLKKSGWKVITVWECELKSKARTDKTMKRVTRRIMGTF